MKNENKNTEEYKVTMELVDGLLVKFFRGLYQRQVIIIPPLSGFGYYQIREEYLSQSIAHCYLCTNEKMID